MIDLIVMLIVLGVLMLMVFMGAAITEAILEEVEQATYEANWITSETGDPKCSACGEYAWYRDIYGHVRKSKYCPRCGARMKGE